jgi:AraC-like DNA-binding protein
MLSDMSRAHKEVPTPSPLPPAIARWLTARAIDPAPLLARCGLPAGLAAEEQWAIGPSALDELMAEAGALAGDPFFGLRLPAELELRRYGLHELVARAAPTVRAAVASVVRYRSLIHPRFELRLEEDAGEARIRQRLLGYPRGVGRHSHEYALATTMVHLRRELDGPLPALRVWFMNARPRDLVPLYRFFGTRALDFGCADNGVALPAEALDRPTRSGDPRLLATVEPLAEAALRAQPPASDFASEVTTRIRALLPDGADAAAVAKALHMSPRTLQRRLGDEGTRFSDVLDEARAGLARDWLGGGNEPLAEIGWRLGFADLAGFSRAFKRWTGEPPGTYRARTRPAR